MYEYIRGTFIGINKDYIIVENNGIGYKIFTSGSTMAEMPKIDEQVLIYLIQIVRQDFIGLYGFSTKEELELFNKLITINGVGAKAALSLLSIASVDNLKYAIVSGNEKTIIKAPGIGKKTAQRIILELKDKIEIKDIINNDVQDGIKSDISVQRNIGEALAALISLGYSEKEAEKAIKTIDKEQALEGIIKDCLKHLMS